MPLGKVLVLDDEKLSRTYLQKILKTAGYRTATYASAKEVLADGEPSEPSCLLLDAVLPEMDGPTLQTRLQQLNWKVPVVYVTAHASVPLILEVWKAGALDVLTKPIDRATLLPAVEKAMSVSRRMAHRHRAQAGDKARVAVLTAREREVLSWIIAGKLNKEVADTLSITERTVKAHRSSIMEKLQANSVVDLVRLADRMGLAPGGI